MADTRMNQQEREQFLADLHVGVLSIPRNDNAPLSAPIWYQYSVGGELWVLTGAQSRKGKLLSQGTKVSLVAQREDPPYAYLTVEGSVAEIRPAISSDTLEMATRYLGPNMGKAYANQNADNGSIKLVIQPQRWLSVDYAKAGLDLS